MYKIFELLLESHPDGPGWKLHVCTASLREVGTESVELGNIYSLKGLRACLLHDIAYIDKLIAIDDALGSGDE